MVVDGKSATDFTQHHTYDVVVVGGGTAGAYAAAAAADEGAQVAILERQPEERAGHIACGDAHRDPHGLPGPIDGDRIVAAAIKDEGGRHRAIERVLLRDPERGERLEVPYPDGKESNVVDRHAYGQAILAEARRCGADIFFETPFRDLIVGDGRVQGVVATHEGTPAAFDAGVVVDAAGALSDVQADLDHHPLQEESPWDTNVGIHQYTMAYRDIARLPDDVNYPFPDALVVEPITPETMDRLPRGYYWEWPSPAGSTDGGGRINVGLGYQDPTADAFSMTRVLREMLDQEQYRPWFQDACSRRKFDGAEADRRGSMLSTRRPYDCPIMPGFIAAGEAAATTQPMFGKGIMYAAKSGHLAGTYAARAALDGDVSVHALWPAWHRFMTEEELGAVGAAHAKADVFNVALTSPTVPLELTRRIPTHLPTDEFMNAVEGAEMELGLADRLRVLGKYALSNVREILTGEERWTQVRAFGKGLRIAGLAPLAETMYDHYTRFPAEPGADHEAFQAWKARRDELLVRVYAGAGVPGREHWKYELPDLPGSRVNRQLERIAARR